MKKTWNKGEKMKDYIYGKNAVANALISGQNIINLYMSPSFFDKKINQLIKEKHIKYTKTNDLNKYVGNVVHQGIVCEIEEYEYDVWNGMLGMFTSAYSVSNNIRAFLYDGKPTYIYFEVTTRRN